MAPKITTVNRLEEVSLIEAGLDLTSGRKPPLAVLTESQLPARARGDVVSSIDKLLEGRVAGLKCWDVDLLSVFSAKAAIVLVLAAGTVSCSFFDATQAAQQRRSANATRR